MMQLEPGGLVTGSGEGRGVGLRETELGERRQLGEDLLGDRLWDFILGAAVEKALADRRHQFMRTMAAHRPTEMVGFGTREAGAVHRDLEDLFLVEHDAERLLEDRLQARMDVHDRLLALLAPQVWVYCVALDRPRPNDGNLDDEIVERLGA